MLLGCGVGEHADPAVDRVEGPAEGVAHDHGARPGVVGQGSEPVAQAGDLGGQQQPVRAERDFADREDRGQRQSLLLEHPRQMLADLLDGLRRHPVEHDGDRRTSFGGLPQQRPRDGIGIPSRGCHEEPEVSGRQELRREIAVGGDDRVDVRRVEQGQPAGEGGRGHQTHR